MATIRFAGGGLGEKHGAVRCDLKYPFSPVEVDYGDGNGWVCTEYHCGSAQVKDLQSLQGWVNNLSVTRESLKNLPPLLAENDIGQRLYRLSVLGAIGRHLFAVDG